MFDTDQAAGLRRMITKSAARVIAVVGGRNGSGSTSMVVNLASTWAALGKEVLILDEHVSPNNVGNSLALKPRYDLLSVVRGDKRLRDVMLRSGNGIRILPVARVMQTLSRLAENERERMSALLTHAAMGFDVILVDAAVHEGYSICASLSSNEPLLLLINGMLGGMAESFAMIKQISAQNGRKTFDIVINKVKNESEARKIFDTIAQTAWQNLQVRLDYMGYIPLDEKLKQATQLSHSVVGMFPHAQSSLEFRRLAQQLLLEKNTVEQEVRGFDKVMQRLILQARPSNNVVFASS